MIAYGTTPLTTIQAGGALNPQPNGLFTISVLASSGLKLDTGAPCHDGDVLSCQPNSTFQARPAGTAGAWEVCTVNGGYVTFNPAGIPFTFAFVSSVPNG